MTTLTHQRLKELLHQRNCTPSSAAAIDADIQAHYSQRHAVLALDMSGFSRLTLEHGIIHFLAMIQHMEAIATPIVVEHQGTLFKQEADNLFAVFPTVDQAVNASVKLLATLAIANQTIPENQALYASIGIGYGDLIEIKEEGRLCDVYGNEMNLASKLGEDLAEPSEILLTEAAYRQMTTDSYTVEIRTVTISKVEMVVHKLNHR